MNNNRKTRGVVKSDKPLDNNINTLKDLGNAIKYKRTCSGLSITRTAALCNISDKTLQAIEKGEDSKFSTILKVSKMLGLKFKVDGL